ncbi:MAG TPA: hypothetical protein VHP12_00395 [Chitinophagaceae bacterium]|nr:hypothetical protein [Chitinophagaceae bacterium]
MFLIAIISFNNVQSQFRKTDTTVKVGKAGYVIICNNKNADKNLITIKPVGFESEARQMEFYIKGRIKSVQIDDFNNDGFPDLIIFSEGGGENPIEHVNIYALTSVENKSYAPIYFPDILDDAKLRDGYKGHDKFSLMEGTVFRTFPIYKPDDAADKPTGGKRVVQYKMISEQGIFKFKAIRTYEIK